MREVPRPGVMPRPPGAGQSRDGCDEHCEERHEDRGAQACAPRESDVKHGYFSSFSRLRG
jgi:hypothetical protein